MRAITGCREENEEESEECVEVDLGSRSGSSFLHNDGNANGAASHDSDVDLGHDSSAKLVRKPTPERPHQRPEERPKESVDGRHWRIFVGTHRDRAAGCALAVRVVFRAFHIAENVLDEFRERRREADEGAKADNIEPCHDVCVRVLEDDHL